MDHNRKSTIVAHGLIRVKNEFELMILIFTSHAAFSTTSLKSTLFNYIFLIHEFEIATQTTSRAAEISITSYQSHTLQFNTHNKLKFAIKYIH